MNVEWCDFAVFSNGQVVVDRVLAEYDFWLELSETFDRFMSSTLSLKYFLELYLLLYSRILVILLLSHSYVNNYVTTFTC